MHYTSKEVYEFIFKQTQDPIVERRTCTRTWQNFPIFQKEIQLLDKISPIIGSKKYQISLPKLSPIARQIKRLIRRNERKFYKFINKEWKQEITTISPERWYIIISQSDFLEYNHLQYGRQYSGNFFDDIGQLFNSMPYPSKLTNNMENSDYCNQETDAKNCYLNAWGHGNQNSLYSTYSLNGIWIVDSYRVMKSEQVYQSINIHNSQKIFFSSEIYNSYNVFFSRDNKWCQNILFGFWLHNVSYIYKNKKITKEEWEKKYLFYKDKMSSYKWLLEVMKEYNKFISKFPVKWINNVNCENVFWIHELINGKNIILSSTWEESQDVMYANIFAMIDDSIDVESFWRWKKSYNIASSIQIINCIVWSHMIENVESSIYAYSVRNSSFLLWCVWLQYKEYCILNTQYDKESWEKNTVKIIKDLQSQNKFWDFFDPAYSPFPYNDSVAYDYFPIKKIIIDWKEDIINADGIWTVTILNPNIFISDAVLDFWWEEKVNIKRRTKENNINIPDGLKQILARDLSDTIYDIHDTILDQVILCEITGRPFRIVWLELEFYRKHGLPIPRKHPDVRHQERMKIRQGRQLHLRHCDKCNIEMLSVYPEDYKWKVYCETCYNKEIYW